LIVAPGGDLFCAACAEDLEEVTLLLCDGCDVEMPLEETGLSAIPAGDWFCPKCDANRKVKKELDAENSKSRGGKANGKISVAANPISEQANQKRRSTRKTC
jgi:hypothetical protein